VLESVVGLNLLELVFELCSKLLLNLVDPLEHFLAGARNNLVFLIYFLQESKALLDLLVIKVIHIVSLGLVSLPFWLHHHRLLPKLTFSAHPRALCLYSVSSLFVLLELQRQLNLFS